MTATQPYYPLATELQQLKNLVQEAVECVSVKAFAYFSRYETPARTILQVCEIR